jgi:hypothetical protein
VASAYAGVGVVSPQVQAEALRLWQRFCGGSGSDGGNDAGVSVHCKVATEDVRDVQQHTLNIPSRQAGQQVVFVQPPSVHTKHDVVVTGGGGAAPKTVIYVKPAKNTNEVNILDQTQPASAPQKPSLYFLKEEKSGASQDFRAADQVAGSRLVEKTEGFLVGDRVSRGNGREIADDRLSSSRNREVFLDSLADVRFISTGNGRRMRVFRSAGRVARQVT